ncbi:Uncharacterised protein [Mycobacteroides abscessus subsp. abscessus]|nr:Uncharacterised protein [Mycobacteroides abscessus subsp. abscessus]
MHTCRSGIQHCTRKRVATLVLKSCSGAINVAGTVADTVKKAIAATHAST